MMHSWRRMEVARESVVRVGIDAVGILQVEVQDAEVGINLPE